MAEKEKKSIWSQLSEVNVDSYVDQKNKGNSDSPKFLSWMAAWKFVNEQFPDNVSFSIKEWDGKPYLVDEPLGIMVQTSVTINGVTRNQHHFVMDSKNKAQRIVPYTYFVNHKGKEVEKKVEAATMFDINTAIMRCLAKNLAIFGLGYELYIKEDILKYIKETEAEEEQRKIEAEEAKKQEEYMAELEKQADAAIERINAQTDRNELIALLNGDLSEVKKIARVYEAGRKKFSEFSQKENEKKEVQDGAA